MSNSITFNEGVDKPIVVFFYVSYGGSCHLMRPAFEDLMENFKDQVHFVLLEKGENVEEEIKCQVKKFPTILFLRQEKEISRLVGLVNRAELYSHTNNLISTILG